MIDPVTGPGSLGHASVGPELPVGTVTFLRTDIEDSMTMALHAGGAWDDIVATHHGLIRMAIADHGGVIVRTEGDAVFAAFPEAGAAVSAAVAAQRSLTTHDWPSVATPRVRMGLHTGEAHLSGDDYGGFEVNRAARVAAVGHGGQIVLSGTTAGLVRDTLAEDVGLEPLGRHRLRGVPRPDDLWQTLVPGLPQRFPPLRTAGADLGNLPDRLTSFVGRDDDIERVAALAGQARLVTLTGPGGIGKSSLAVEVARSLAGDAPDGVWFVPLDEVDDPERVVGAIARTIGLFDGGAGTAADAMPRYLAERSVLLVLDNYEHVLEAAPEVTAILRASPRSRVLVTSRAPLRVGGEQEYPVRPLTVGDADAGARSLFEDRARAVIPGWDPGRDQGVVDEICALLDGLPLGVELAAARVGRLPLTAMRDRLANRLPLPGAGPRDAPARQRTLEGAVTWSHDLLSPEEQTVLHLVGVFDGGFDVDQVAAAIGEGTADRVNALDALTSLVEHSLLHPDLAADDHMASPPAGGAPIRFRMLRTIQSFALARLAEDGTEQEVRRRHAGAYLALAEQGATHLSSSDQAAWQLRLARDVPNLRGAVGWSIETGEADLALRLVAALWRFWQRDGHLDEGRGLAARALAMPGAQAPSTPRLWAAGAAGNIAYWQNDMAEARLWYDEQLALAHILGDDAGIADATFNLGHLAFLDNADPTVLAAIATDAQRRYMDLGDAVGIARTRWALGNIAMGAAYLDTAVETFEQSLRDFEALGDSQYHAMVCGSLGWAWFMKGNIAEACRWSIRAVVETHAMHDLGTTTISLHVGVLVAALMGRYEDAARLSGAFESLCEQYGVRPPATLERFIDQRDPFAIAREALPAETWQACFEEGRQMDLDAAVALVVEAGSAPSG